MKTDRELLELAAKAVGFGAPGSGDFTWTESEYPRKSGKHGALWNYVGWCDTAEMWNPLSDDGDAFRLAVKLRIKFEIHPTHPFVAAFAPDFIGKFEEEITEDVMEATRRAIVRAAARLGEQK